MPGDGDLKAIEGIAWIMDRAVRVPGTPLRFGFDAVIGLIPGAGDAVSGLIHLGVIGASVYRYRLPKPVVARMLANALLDAGIGVVPVVGDVADAAFKAHSRNLALLRECLDDRAKGRETAARSSRRFFIGIALLFGLTALGLLSLLAVTTILLVRWLF
jgi:hypothetical protein